MTTSGPLDPVEVGSAASLTVEFSDKGILDTHSAQWEWGDGQTSAGAVTETGGSGSAAGTHAHAAPGVYTVKLTVTDKDGDSDSEYYRYVVVYDPSGGHVIGGGWINSPVGAYILSAASLPLGRLAMPIIVKTDRSRLINKPIG